MRKGLDERLIQRSAGWADPSAVFALERRNVRAEWK